MAKFLTLEGRGSTSSSKWITIVPKGEQETIDVAHIDTASTIDPPNSIYSQITVVGSQRGGKSTLLNSLLTIGLEGVAALDDKLHAKAKPEESKGGDATEIFRTSASNHEPCTQGIDIFPSPATTLRSTNGKQHFAFADVEGVGNRGSAFMFNLMAPMLLTSNAVIYNWEGSLRPDTYVAFCASSLQFVQLPASFALAACYRKSVPWLPMLID